MKTGISQAKIRKKWISRGGAGQEEKAWSIRKPTRRVFSLGGQNGMA